MKFLIPLTCAALLAACAPSFQTTSGAEFVAARPGFIDPEIAAAAAVEPDLRFPARIGVARLTGYGELSAPSGEEVQALGRIAAVAQLGAVVPLTSFALDSEDRGSRLDQMELRKIAARQHADYLVIYQLNTRGRTGLAEAAFIDVRNGYIYANTQATAGIGWMGQERAEARLAKALMPEIEAMAEGLAARAGR
ncbi:hypothetical protein AADZ90_006460 [Aestuariibius sp. 2305UL40-4]|uniref:hypothetical protein n=1 Tax=Aestuariibius violaceus TaxID=3234132 RepID=UPI00345E5E97